MHRNEKWIKLTGIVLCEAFAVFTVITLLSDSDPTGLAMALATVLYILLPALLEKLFHCELSLSFYIFVLAYATGPMIGHCWKFYYTVPGWDKLLHFSGGVVFAVLGAYLFDLLLRKNDNTIVRAIFALCFSVAIAAVWEFLEFGLDMLFDMDTQADTVIHGITSHLLGADIGATGSITDIQSVIANGVALPVAGYLDIGLIDSMTDMILESIGAVITCALIMVDRGKHPLICSLLPEYRKEER